MDNDIDFYELFGVEPPPAVVARPFPRTVAGLVAQYEKDDIVLLTHSENRCEGERCPVHKPTRHHLSEMPISWRNDAMMFERTCGCGVGHPDPDQFEHWVAIGDAYKAAHGCCGCCAKHDPLMIAWSRARGSTYAEKHRLPATTRTVTSADQMRGLSPDSFNAVYFAPPPPGVPWPEWPQMLEQLAVIDAMR